MSRVFRLLLHTREALYRRGYLRTFQLSHPVISVGNLTVGGTGKTPLVMALAERFRLEGYRPVVLSRGYKRKSAGMQIVSRGDGPLVSWQEAGDEPFLIARRVPGVAVVVGSDRHEAGRLAEREGLGDLFILDDGFQHRGLFRDVDLVMIDPGEWTAGEQLLPTGRWREPKSALARADAACVQDSVGSTTLSLPVPAFLVRTRIEGLYRGCEPVPVASVLNQPVTAFAGIAKPERFFNALRSMGIAATRCVQFRDHHLYSAHDIEKLGHGIRITTEKDMVRLEGMAPADFLHLRISANIPDVDDLMKLIQHRLSGRTN